MSNSRRKTITHKYINKGEKHKKRECDIKM